MKVSIVLLMIASTFCGYAQTDFSGSWILNVDKSQFNNTPGVPAANKMLVEQKNGTIAFQRNDRPKEMVKIGDTAGNEIIEGDNKTKVTMKLAGNKSHLIETRTYFYEKDPEAEVASQKTRTWSLSYDKKTLTILDQIKSTAGKTYSMVVVYDRQ